MRRVLVTAMAGWLGVSAGALAQAPRFDAASETCKPYQKGVLDRQWQVSAPRNPPPAGQPITVGLREKYADAGQRTVVRARILGAAAPVVSKPITVAGDDFADVEYPRDFPSTRPLPPGVYTVHWVLAEGDGFLTCDGFVVR
jgi:hypothetical protein